jgi:hypothetical protein
MNITNLRDLARHLGVEPVTSFENFGAGGLAGRIGKVIFRSTECGCTFNAEPGEQCVTISGYAEGADAECESYQFNYPFSSMEFDEQLDLCDQEGIEMWNEWNPECDGQPDEAQEWHDFDPDC